MVACLRHFSSSIGFLSHCSFEKIVEEMVKNLHSLLCIFLKKYKFRNDEHGSVPTSFFLKNFYLIAWAKK